jgi:5-methylcytosine-specific restriction enzyme subunit McrC
VYPHDPVRPSTSQAEQFSPWSLDDRRKIVFTALPHVGSDAVIKLRDLIVRMTPERYAWYPQA